MKTLNTAQLKTSLTAIASNNSTEKLLTVIAHTIHNGLVHHNIMPEHMKAIRDSNVNREFKAALAKYMPMSWNKEKEAYQFSNKKAENMRLKLGLEFRVSTVEDVADALPAMFEAKAKRVQADFSIDEYTAKMATKLAKEGIADAELIAQLVNMLAKDPSALGNAAKAVFAVTAEVEAEAV
ncbi:hypothetical protein NVP1077O_66 [Vibrio phage 1.077.O._10N.261.45.A10]|nr:hypothetical protein NVP1070O_66 [Vibrio phage 1.070.O._10N.261.45.B2]AUR85644.1 hypothetical protein NVP1077O_66 [Vibrio phage 1.077.O._10N.261.45.A10]